MCEMGVAMHAVGVAMREVGVAMRRRLIAAAQFPSTNTNYLYKYYAPAKLYAGTWKSTKVKKLHKTLRRQAHTSMVRSAEHVR